MLPFPAKKKIKGRTLSFCMKKKCGIDLILKHERSDRGGAREGEKSRISRTNRISSWTPSQKGESIPKKGTPQEKELKKIKGWERNRDMRRGAITGRKGRRSGKRQTQQEKGIAESPKAGPRRLSAREKRFDLEMKNLEDCQGRTKRFGSRDTGSERDLTGRCTNRGKYGSMGKESC